MKNAFDREEREEIFWGRNLWLIYIQRNHFSKLNSCVDKGWRFPAASTSNATLMTLAQGISMESDKKSTISG